MASPAKYGPMQRGVILWEKGSVCCTCRAPATTNLIEVLLWSKGVQIERTLFTDTEDAARFALDKLRAYNALERHS
jgi:hypothetical protein